jgi:hypothetical protein
MLRKTFPLYFIMIMLAPLTSLAEAGKVPQEKRPRLDAKTVLRGSGFRITTIHPMRGDFSQYDKLEIANMTNEVGDRVPGYQLEKYTVDLARTFQKEGTFKQVIRVEKPQFAVQPVEPAPGQVSEGTQAASYGGAASSAGGGTTFLPARFRSSSQPAAGGVSGPSNLDPSGEADPPGVPLPQPANPMGVTLTDGQKRTMVITSELIYYKKGNRGLRALGLGGGYERFVVRFHIYDEELGLELAMGNIAGEVDDGFGAIPFLAGDDDGRKAVAGALVNRVEVRRAKADQ